MTRASGSNLGTLRAESFNRIPRSVVSALSAKVPEAPLAKSEKSDPQKHRIGKEAITVYMPVGVRKALKLLAVELDMDMDDLIAEAFNFVFAAHGRAEIAPRKTKL